MGLSKTSLERLSGVHPDLVRVVMKAAAQAFPFMVIEGLRSPERQKELFEAGKSKTMHSRHLTGHAVDLGPMDPEGKIPWANKSAFKALADLMLQCAKWEKVPLEWGGNFHSFYDGPHFQLPFGAYIEMERKDGEEKEKGL